MRSGGETQGPCGDGRVWLGIAAGRGGRKVGRRNTVSAVAVAVVGLLHRYFPVLEMVGWTQPLGRRVFGLTPEFAAASNRSAANQRLHHEFRAGGWLWGVSAEALAQRPRGSFGVATLTGRLHVRPQVGRAAHGSTGFLSARFTSRPKKHASPSPPCRSHGPGRPRRIGGNRRGRFPPAVQRGFDAAPTGLTPEHLLGAAWAARFNGAVNCLAKESGHVDAGIAVMARGQLQPDGPPHFRWSGA